MPRQPVFTEVMDVIERRIAAGEYMLEDLPGERTLAEQVGVSYMTARKAVLKLIEKEVLSRRPNGTLVVHERLQERIGRRHVALLVPAYPSTHLMRCRLGLTRAMTRRDILHRTFEYTHWDDSIVAQALSGSDGVIVIPMSEPMPARVLKAVRESDTKVVFFDDDMTEHGIPSVSLYPREHVREVFEHLWSLGHRRIDCLNTQGHSDEVDHRIAYWRAWLRERGGEGALWDDPAPAYTDPTSRAHRIMRAIVEGRDHPLSAVVCTTQPAAMGAIRACCDVGLRVGEDVSICTVNNEPTGRYSCPSLTGLEMPDLEPLVDQALAWFVGADGEWDGDPLILPASSDLFRGESTGPAPGGT